MSNINDVVIKIATVNGTGSASANGLLMKSIFRMGIPVVGKNYFPSNIQGLPTWYEVRVTGEGHCARANRVDVMIAMNSRTYARDMAEVASGGWLIYDSTWPRSQLLDREDITVIGVPLSKMCNEHFEGARARILMKNIAYVGVVAALLDIDLAVITTLLEETFASKKHMVKSNFEAISWVTTMRVPTSFARCRRKWRPWTRRVATSLSMATRQRVLGVFTLAPPLVPGTRLLLRHL